MADTATLPTTAPATDPVIVAVLDSLVAVVTGTQASVTEFKVPSNPASHVQFPMNALPAGDLELGGHAAP